MQSRTALFPIGNTSYIASLKNRGLDNFVGAEHPADLAEIASLEGFELATLIEMKLEYAENISPACFPASAKERIKERIREWLDAERH